MDYILSFLAVAFFPLALAAYGGHLAAEVLEREKRTKALWIVWCLAGVGVLFAGGQQYRAYRSDQAIQAVQGKRDTDAKQLQGKLDASIQREEYMKGQLGSIALMIGKVGEEGKSSQIGQLASAIKNIAANSGTPPGSPHLIKIDAPQPGNFTVSHGLGCYPSAVIVQMTSFGFIALQSSKEYDATNIYLTASDSKLTADLLVWCQP
jgi:hypothetical protein